MNNKVSIIIPTHKGSEVVKRAVDSALNQTYSEIEVIVVDDNGVGTEEQVTTQRILQDYIEKNKIRYIPHEVNINGAAARNTGVKAATGEYVTLLDDDDTYYSTKIEDEINVFLKLPDEYGLVYCSIDCDYGNSIHTAHARKSGNLLKELLYHSVVIGSDTLMVRREYYLEIGGFDESFKRHQDFEFTARIADKWKIMAIDKSGIKSYEIGRNVPKDKEKAVEYRRHYLQKMMPLISKFSKFTSRQIVSVNYVQLYGPELRKFKVREVYLACKKNCAEFIANYSFLTFITSIFVIEFNKIKRKIQ